jgi:hypothetical protein
MSRNAPGWTIAFLRALERSGEIRAAAEDAGIDFSTAYARRKAHPAFAEEWAAALAAHRVRLTEEEALRCFDFARESLRSAQSEKEAAFDAAGTNELVVAAGQVRRASPERWGKAKSQAFLAELTASANVRRAARAAGLSTTALYRRRAKDRQLAAAWDQAIEAGKARLQAMLVAAANAALDPGDLPDPEDSPLPPVTVREAIEIAKLKGPGALAQAPEQRHIATQFIAETDTQPAAGSTVSLAIQMTPEPGWHGYWKNPGRQRHGADVEWTLPPGAAAGPLEYPVPGG